MIACPASPWLPPPDCPPAGVRARLWLKGPWLGQRNEQSFLWLHLEDGRVLAFDLPADAFGDDRALRELVDQIAEDCRGTLLAVRLGDGVAIPLYAATAAPVPDLPWGDSRHRAARGFAEGLDQEVLGLLAGLNRHRRWDSLRNYNRLAALDPGLRERRLQALTRFPLLVAPVLLSAHRRLDLGGGKRHASPCRASIGCRARRCRALPPLWSLASWGRPICRRSTAASTLTRISPRPSPSMCTPGS